MSCSSVHETMLPRHLHSTGQQSGGTHLPWVAAQKTRRIASDLAPRDIVSPRKRLLRIHLTARPAIAQPWDDSALLARRISIIARHKRTTNSNKKRTNSYRRANEFKTSGVALCRTHQIAEQMPTRAHHTATRRLHSPILFRASDSEEDCCAASARARYDLPQLCQPASQPSV